jgi:hypothetical protein
MVLFDFENNFPGDINTIFDSSFGNILYLTNMEISNTNGSVSGNNSISSNNSQTDLVILFTTIMTSATVFFHIKATTTTTVTVTILDSNNTQIGAALNLNLTTSFVAINEDPTWTPEFSKLKITKSNPTDVIVIDEVSVFIGTSPFPPLAITDYGITTEQTPLNISVLLNDKDPANFPLSLLSFSSASNGIVTNIGGNVLKYVPNAGFQGVDTFNYILQSDIPLTSTGNVIITVSGLPTTPPTAVNDVVLVGVNNFVDINVLINDIDPTDTGLDVISTTAPTLGTTLINVDKTIRYTAGATIGNDLFTYTIESPLTTLQSVGTVNIVIALNVNYTCRLFNFDSSSEGDTQDIFDTSNQYSLNLEFLSVDTVTETISDFNVISTNFQGTLQSDINSQVPFIPSSAFFYIRVEISMVVTIKLFDVNGIQTGIDLVINATPAFQLVSPDPTWLISTSSVIQITRSFTSVDVFIDNLELCISNDQLTFPPTAIDDSVFTGVDEPVTINILNNDSDFNNSVLTIQSFTQGTSGTVTQLNNTLVYTPSLSFVGNDIFTYTIVNNQGLTATANVFVDVILKPFANPDTFNVQSAHRNVIDVLANDVDTIGGGLTILTFTQPSTGFLILNPDQSFDYIADNRTAIETFTYTIRDANFTLATAIVTVDIQYRLLCKPDKVLVFNQGMTVFDVLNNDEDMLSLGLTINSVTQPLTGVIENLIIHLRYIPDGIFIGIECFTYTGRDIAGNLSTAEACVYVYPPIIAEDDTNTTIKNISVLTNVLANDYNIVPLGLLLIRSVTQSVNGTVTFVSPNVTYTPNLDFVGIDTFTYTMFDENNVEGTGTVTITVFDIPTATTDNIFILINTSIIINVLNNDIDPLGLGLTVINVSIPINGIAIIIGNTIQYTPSPTFFGLETFTYTVRDENNVTDVGIINVQVNRAPVANDDIVTTILNESVIIDVLNNDIDIENTGSLLIQSTTLSANGTVTIFNNEIIYTPNTGFIGSDSFTYVIIDENNNTGSATVNLTIFPKPDIIDDTITTIQNTPIVICVLDNDIDTSLTGLAILSVIQPSHGTTVINANKIIYTPDSGYFGPDDFEYTAIDGNNVTGIATVTVDTFRPPIANDDNVSVLVGISLSIHVLLNDVDPEGNGLDIINISSPSNGVAILVGNQILYTPNSGFFGLDTFTYTIEDSNGTQDTCNVNVQVNRAPIANNDNVHTISNVPITIDVLDNDIDVENSGLAIFSTTSPSNGTISIVNDEIFYIPNISFIGIDTFTYTIIDGNNNTDTAVVTLNIFPQPDINDDIISTSENIPVTICVLDNDIDPSGTGLTVTSVTQPIHGTVIISSNKVIYTPAPNFIGTDTFTYTAIDGNGISGTATVTINTNKKPVANNDVLFVGQDSIVLDVLNNDIDSTGNGLTILSISSPTNGILINNITFLTYQQTINGYGVDTFTYTIIDSNGSTDTAIVTLNINAKPIANDDEYITYDNTSILMTVLANDIDNSGGGLIISNITTPYNGISIIQGNNVLYVPDFDFTGTDQFTYDITDSFGLTDTGNIFIEIFSKPIVVNDSVITYEETSIDVDILVNDINNTDTKLEIINFTQPDIGTVLLNNDIITFTPETGFIGEYFSTYTIEDINGGTDTGIINYIVKPNVNCTDGSINKSIICVNFNNSNVNDIHIYDVLNNKWTFTNFKIGFDSLYPLEHYVLVSKESEEKYCLELSEVFYPYSEKLLSLRVDKYVKRKNRYIRKENIKKILINNKQLHKKLLLITNPLERIKLIKRNISNNFNTTTKPSNKYTPAGIKFMKNPLIKSKISKKLKSKQIKIYRSNHTSTNALIQVLDKNDNIIGNSITVNLTTTYKNIIPDIDWSNGHARKILISIDDPTLTIYIRNLKYTTIVKSDDNTNNHTACNYNNACNCKNITLHTLYDDVSYILNTISEWYSITKCVSSRIE